MEITILIENNPDSGNQLAAEHGLSVYVENEGSRFLIDTGQSENFINNAAHLGINLFKVDYTVITHGHYDHINGLPGFLKINPTAQIILSPLVLQHDFYSIKQGGKKNIGKNFAAVLINPDRLVHVTSDCSFDSGLRVIARAEVETRESARGEFRMSLAGKEIRDDFDHEIIPYLMVPEGAVVFTGCAHQGLFSILQTIRAKIAPQKIVAAVGGFHLPEGTDEKEVNLLAGLLEVHFPETLFYTGHCTGKDAFTLLKSRLGVRLSPICTGSKIIINTDMKKIALPVTSANKIDDHFGHCEKYAVYTISEQNEIVAVDELESEQGCGCKSNIAGTLAKMGVSEMLAGGIGNGAVNVLANNSISVVRGCSGDAAEVVKSYLSGGVLDSGINCAQHEHHHHSEGHQCSHH